MRAALRREEKSRQGSRAGAGRAPGAGDPVHGGRTLGEKDGYAILDCAPCGFIHLSPLPSEHDLLRIYRDEYFSTEKPDFTERVREDEEWWKIVHDERLGFMESALGGGPGRVLDIGCGPGFFLRRAAARGWEGLGVEPSSMAAEEAAAQGVRVRKGFFDGGAMKREGLSFDAVHLSEVLEHVREPLKVLGGAFSLLEPGGIACVVVPNDFSPVQEVLRDRLGYDDYWVAAPHHINYFSFDSLGSLMKRAGFSLVRTEATFPMDFFLLMGERYVGDDALGRRCHHMRTRLDIMLSDPRLRAFKRDMYALMARRGIGREAVIFGRKPKKEDS